MFLFRLNPQLRASRYWLCLFSEMDLSVSVSKMMPNGLVTKIMEQTNLQPDCKDKGEPCPILVGAIGFNPEDEESFNRFYQIPRANQRSYAAVSNAEITRSDILLVNYDRVEALKEKESILAALPQIQVVAVSKGPLTDPPPHHIRGLLFAARVLTTLDKVSLQSHDAVSEQAPMAAITDQPPIKTASDQKPLTDLAAPMQPLPEMPVTQGLATVLPKQVEEQADQLPEVIAPKPAPQETTINPDGYRALVVDDSVAIQKSLELNLATLSQISVIDFADSGESAIEKAEAKQYDLIFLDVMMPGIDGYETCTRLRKKPEYKKTPIIMVSGKTSPLDEVKGVMAGCTTYLTKPVQQEAFKKLSIRVLAWLGKQKVS
jgi:two-component system, cell cycle response regulator